jgi:hypothetical protein
MVLATSLISRVMRVLELRVKAVELDENAKLFLSRSQSSKINKEIIHIVAHKFGGTAYTIRGNEVRDRHNIGDHDQLVFLEVTIEDASEFVDEVLRSARVLFTKVTTVITAFCAAKAHP